MTLEQPGWEPRPIQEVPREQAIARAENEIYARKRLRLAAYLLCFFLGTLGLHRFYLHRNGSGLAMLLITLLTLGFGVLITLPWAFIDLFLIPGIIAQENRKLRYEAYGRFGLAPGSR
jgi:TM2 domain-containing membrane protein YozV